MNRYRLVALIAGLVLLVVGIPTRPAVAASEWSNLYLGSQRWRSSIDPIRIGRAILFPLGGVSELLGIEVEWSLDRVPGIILRSGTTTVRIRPGDTTAWVNEKSVTLLQAPINQDHVVYIPGQVVEALGFRISRPPDEPGTELEQVATLTPLSASAQASPIRILVDGREVPTDVAPVLVNGRVLVPVRIISEALGAFVTWDQATRVIEIQDMYHGLHDKHGAWNLPRVWMHMEVGNPDVVWYDREWANASLSQPLRHDLLKRELAVVLRLDESPRLVAGRTMVPLRFITEALDYHVQWDGVNRRVMIDTMRPAERKEVASSYKGAVLRRQLVFEMYPSEFRAIDPDVVARALQAFTGMLALDLADSEFKVEFAYDSVRIRINRVWDPYLDVYPTHVVRWFHTKETADELRYHLRMEDAIQEAGRSISGAGAKLAAVIVGQVPVIQNIVTIADGVDALLTMSKAGDDLSEKQFEITMQECPIRAENESLKRKTAFGMGIVQSLSGWYCMTGYTDKPVSSQPPGGRYWYDYPQAVPPDCSAKVESCREKPVDG